MSTLLTEAKEYMINDLSDALLESDLDYDVIASVQEEIEENFETWVTEWALLQEAPSVLTKGAGGSTPGISRKVAEKLGLHFASNPEEYVKARNRALAYKSSKLPGPGNPKPPKKGMSLSKKVLLGAALGLGAYLIYKAVKAKLDKCRKKCGKDQACLYKCRIDYQKGIIQALKKNEQELRKAGKLTDRKKKAIEKGIKKAQLKIRQYEAKLRKAK